MQQQTHFHTPVLLFVELAGTGKTTFALPIADVFGRTIWPENPLWRIVHLALDLRDVSKVQPEMNLDILSITTIFG